MKVGIIGYGYVGQAMDYIISDHITTMIVDPYKKVMGQKTLTEAKDSEIMFICVPTPTSDTGEVNLTAFNDVMSKLKDYTGIIVIKSTIPAEHIPTWSNICYNPEFLNQNEHISNALEPKAVILGGLANVTGKVENFYEEHTYTRGVPEEDGIEYAHCTIQEASNFKYLRNVKQAYNVLFWNFVHETTGNARLYSKMMEHLPVGENSQVGMDGELGYGGACLPKDVKAFNFCHNHSLTQWMDDYNDELHKK